MSVYFMLVMVLFVVPGGLVLLVWTSYRKARSSAAAGVAFQPAGKLRWEPGAKEGTS